MVSIKICSILCIIIIIILFLNNAHILISIFKFRVNKYKKIHEENKKK